MTDDAGLEQVETGDAAGVENTPELEAARALEWLDTTLQELEGALTRCGECIDAGTLDPAVVSGRMNTLVMRMMAGGAPAPAQ